MTGGWSMAAAAMAAACAAGHGIAGRRMFYQPMRSALTNEIEAGVFAGMWHLITIHFGLSAVALAWSGVVGQPTIVGKVIAAQFAGYAVLYLVISLRLGGPLRLFQWMPFAATSALAGVSAVAPH